MITIIAAIGANNELGKDNDLIWYLPADLKRFKKVTTGHTIIMGRNTFESIGKPLPNRRSIIITRNTSYKKEGCEVVHSLEDAIKLIKDQDNAFIIGGAQIYHEAIEKNLVDQLDITEVHQDFNADVYFPSIDKATWEEVSRVSFTPDENNRYNYSFLSYKKLI
ncbi:MAG: dihydrofolate reductase [Flavobacterium sp.]|nr:dihydrofolate reductase [Flavobacterium sp.]